MTLDPNDICEFLKPYADDYAMRSALRARWPDLFDVIAKIGAPTELEEDEAAAKMPVSFPAIGDLSALQIGLFDNANRKARWGLDIKAWTGGVVKNFAAKPSLHVRCFPWTAKEAVKEITRLTAKGSLGEGAPEFVKRVLELRPTAFLGVMVQKGYGLGTRYLDEHYVLAEISRDAHVQALEFITPSACVECSTGWVDRDAAGRRLTNSAVAAYRASDLEEHVGWATTPLTELDLSQPRSIR